MAHTWNADQLSLVRAWDPWIVRDHSAVGLGLPKDALRFGRTTEAWLIAGVELRARVREVLDGLTPYVEIIGSASVLGLLAKPIVDIAVGRDDTASIEEFDTRLSGAGWIYRGDAGADGGHLFVLETRPLYRVAHLHVVDDGGTQWRDYLRLRDRLRRSDEARKRYEAVKLSLAAQGNGDRTVYTSGKTEIVRSLICDVD